MVSHVSSKSHKKTKKKYIYIYIYLTRNIIVQVTNFRFEKITKKKRKP